jgi:hypothetical protein
MLAPVHDANHDRACIRGDLDQVEPRFGCNSAGFIEWDDADLFTIDPDQSDWAETDLLVDSDSIVDSPPPIFLRRSRPKGCFGLRDPRESPPEVSTHG